MTQQSTYRIINLASGDNIIGQVIRKGASSLTVYRPFQMKVITLMDKAGPNNMFRQEALVMRNWLELSKDQKVTISHNQIVAITEPSEKVSELYDGEKEKEDNPSVMENLLEKLKNSGGLTEEEEELLAIEEEEFADTVAEKMTIEIDPEDIRDLITRIIEDSDNLKNLSSNSADEEYNEQDENDYEDTDKDMFGW